MRKTVSIVVLVLLLTSSIQVIGSESLYVETDSSEDLSEYFDEDTPILISDDESSLPILDMSSIPMDYSGGHFYVDENGKYMGTVDLEELNSAEVSSGDVVMTGISSGTGEPGADDLGGDDSYDPNEGDGRDDPDGLIGISMDFIDFPPMIKNDTCGLSETEIMKEFEAASVVDPDVFHVYNPFAFKTFNISHPESYPDNVDVRYKIEVKYNGEEDIELERLGKGWVNVTPNIGELLYDPTSHWWESDAEPNEDTITVRADITEITPGRHTANIMIYSYYYYCDRTIGNTEEVDYTHVDAIPVSLNVWSDPKDNSSLRYSVLGGESAYKYDLGPIRAVNAESLPSYEYNTDLPANILDEINESNGGGMYHYTETFTEVETVNNPSSIILDVWNAGPEDTKSFYTVEPDLIISNDTDHFLYSEVIRDFHRIINSKNLISIEPYQNQMGENKLPLRLHVSEGEHDYIRIRLDVFSFMEGMKHYIAVNKDHWDFIHPDVSLSDFKKDVLNPKFAFKITSSSGDSFWFEISYSLTGGGNIDVNIAELDSFSPNIVPQGEILNFMNIIAWNPCPMGSLATFDTTVFYQLSGVLAHADLDDINNPPPMDSWVDGDHVSILPETGVIEYGGSPGGDNLQNKAGRNLHNFYVDTTDLEPGTYVYYTSWLAECDYWTGISRGQPPFGEEGCQGMGLAPAINPAKCVFTVKPADWTPDETVEIQDFNPQTMALDNLNTSRTQDIGEIFEYIGNHDIVYEYGPEFSELNAKEFKIEKHGDCTIIYGEELPNVQVVDDSMMFDIYPKKPFDTSPLPTDTIIIVPRKDYVEEKLKPLSTDPDSSFEERGGTTYDPSPNIIANPFSKYDQLAYINGQITHIDPPPLYSNIKTQVLNPVTGEWIDIQDPLRRNPEIGDWVGLLEDAPVGSNLTLRIELYIRDLSEYAGKGLNLPSNGNNHMQGMGNLQWPLTVDSILPDNLEYEQGSAKVRLGAWWNKGASIGGCGCGSNCFLQSTQVKLLDGSYKNIEDIVVGDFVQSYDEETKTIQYGKVTEIIHHDEDEMADYYLVINDDLKVTPDHPFYMNEEWVLAGELKSGDIVGFKDNLYEIQSMEKVFERVPTFNLEIETYHNYMVKSNDCDVLVHNGGSYHPEEEGSTFFSWAEAFVNLEPGLLLRGDNTKLTWNLPSGSLIKIEEYFNVFTNSLDADFYLLGQPIEHPHLGYAPMAPYHPTLNKGKGTTGTVAIEIIFNVTVTQDLDEDTIVTSDLFVDNFYDHYYSNHEGRLWLNTDDAHITTRDYNHPPTVEIFSPSDGETDVSVKTDTFRVMVTDPDNDPVSVSFYWTDKPRFEIDVYTGTMTGLVNVEDFESAVGDQLFGVPSPVNSDYELCTHGNRMETVYNVQSGNFVDVDPRPIQYKYAAVNTGIAEGINLPYWHYETDENGRNGTRVVDPPGVVYYDSDGHPIPRYYNYTYAIYEVAPLVKYLEFEDNNPEYEWYVEVSDIGSTTRSEINSFTTHKSPRINFTYTPEEIHANETITFNKTIVYDPDDLFLDKYIWGWRPQINRTNSEKPDDINNQDMGIADEFETDRYPSGLYAQYRSVGKYSLDGYAAVGNEETLEYSFNGTGNCDVNLKTSYKLYERPEETLQANGVTEEELQEYDFEPSLDLIKKISVTKTITISEGTGDDETNDPEDSTPDDGGGGDIPSEEDDFDEGDTGGGENTDDGGDDEGNDDSPPEESDTDESAGCTIEIKKPSKDYLYLRNERKIPFFIPLVIGNIQVDATITDQTDSVSNIKFFFEGEEKEDFVFNPDESSYIYDLDEKAFSWKELEVRAYNNEGTIVSSEKMDVLIFNL